MTDQSIHDRMIPSRLLISMAILLMVACTPQAAPVTTTSGSAPSSLPPTVTTTTDPLEESAPPRPNVLLQSCDPVTEDPLALLCAAYAIVQENYVDPIDDERLAEGAVLQMTSDLAATADGGDVEAFTCEVPSEAFRGLCEAYAIRVDEVDPAQLTASALRGMIDRGLGDPYSAYLDAELYRQFREEQSGRIQGIGAFVGVSNLEDPGDLEACIELSDTCVLEMTPIAGTPADEAGMEPGDRLISVNGEAVEGSTLEQVVSKVRGPAGTLVELGVRRGDDTLDLTIVRDVIEVPILESRMESPEIGYLHLFAFTTGSHEELRATLQEILESGASTLVLDLRDNPGGSLGEAVAIASEFVSQGVVLYEEFPRGDLEVIRAQPGGLATSPDLTVTVLVNGGSASAAEIVAAALQEGGRANLVGERTFGKNTVQQTFRLDGDEALKLTIARWLTPEQTSFAGVGIQPDVEVPPEEALTRALEILQTETFRPSRIAGS